MIERLGLLQTCMDKRFVEATTSAFEKKTGLEPTEYWHQADAGGAGAFTKNTIGADYAYAHGARIMAWSMHGDKCGGRPGKTDEELRTELDEVIKDRKSRYPEARHFRIFVTEERIDIREV